MARFETRQPPLTGRSALQAALDLCSRENGKNWNGTNLKEALRTRLEKNYGELVVDLVHQANQEEKEEKGRKILDCFIKDKNGTPLNSAQVLASLFRNYYPNQTTTAGELKVGNPRELSSIGKEALTSVFAKGMRQESLFYYLIAEIRARDTNTFKRYYSDPFVLMIRDNYSPELISSSSNPPPLKAVCRYLLHQEEINSKNKEIFNDPFCADEKSLEEQREEILKSMRPAQDEKAFLDALEKLKGLNFQDEQALLTYLERKGFRIPDLLTYLQTSEGLNRFFTFFTFSPEMRMACRLWVYLHTNQLSRLTGNEFKGVGTRSLFEIFAQLWDQKPAVVQLQEPFFISFEIPIPPRNATQYELKNFLLRKIYKALPSKDYEVFFSSIADEYSKGDPEVKKEGVQLLDGLLRWWWFDPGCIDKAIAKLKVA